MKQPFFQADGQRADIEYSSLRELWQKIDALKDAGIFSDFIGRAPPTPEEVETAKESQRHWSETLPVGDDAASIAKGILPRTTDPERSIAARVAGFPLDILSQPGRAAGAALDALSSDEGSFGQRFLRSEPSLYGEGADRTMGGAIAQSILRDPTGPLMAAGGPLLGAAGKLPLLRMLPIVGADARAAKAAQATAAAMQQSAADKARAQAMMSAARNVRGRKGGLISQGMAASRAGERTAKAAPSAGRVPETARRLGKSAAQGAAAGGIVGTIDQGPVSGARGVALGAAGAIPGELIGGIIRGQSRNLLNKMYRFKPTDRARRFAPEVDVMLDPRESPISLSGGQRGTLENVNRKIEPLNRARAQQFSKEQSGSNLSDAYDNAVSSVLDKLGRGEVDAPTASSAIASINDELAMQLPYSKGFSKDFSLVDPATNFRASRTLENFGERGLADPFGKDVLESQVNAPIGAMKQFVGPKVRALPVEIPSWNLQKASNRWFDTGKLNAARAGNIADKSIDQPKILSHKALWEGARPVLEEALPDYRSSAAEFRKWLPIKNALEEKMGAYENNLNVIGSGGDIGRAFDAVTQTNPFILGTNYLGHLMGGAGANAAEALGDRFDRNRKRRKKEREDQE